MNNGAHRIFETLVREIHILCTHFLCPKHFCTLIFELVPLPLTKLVNTNFFFFFNGRRHDKVIYYPEKKHRHQVIICFSMSNRHFMTYFVNVSVTYILHSCSTFCRHPVVYISQLFNTISFSWILWITYSRGPFANARLMYKH